MTPLLRKGLKRHDDSIARYVLPIYGIDVRSVVTPIGSGVLLGHGQHRYLLTAGHVVDQLRYSPLLMWQPHEEQFVVLNGDVVTTKPSGLARSADRIDLALIRLDRETIRSINETDARFASLTIFVNEDPDEGIYAFAGYPVNQNEPALESDPTGQIVKAIPRVMSTFYVRPAAIDVYKRIGCDPRYHFVSILDHRRLVSTSNPAGPGPHPRGMSGGGLFRYGSYDAIAEGKGIAQLVGVGIEYYGDESLIVGTRVAFLRGVLSDA